MSEQPTGVASDSYVGFATGGIKERPLADEVSKLRSEAERATSTLEPLAPRTQDAEGAGPEGRASVSDRHFSWRQTNNVTGVRDQNPCASCWAFAAVAAFEANWTLRHAGVQLNVSEQSVLDCGNAGTCASGYLSKAMYYLVHAGTCKETEYPYQAVQQYCD